MRQEEQHDERGRRFSGHRGAALLLLVSLFLIVNLSLLLSGGIRLGGDSPRYLNGAENLLRGLPLQEKQAYYYGYVLLVAFNEWAGTGLAGVIAVQLVTAGVAAVALYDLGRKLGGESAGLFAAGLFAANPDVARWNAFILTDSLYISLVVLAVWSIHRAFERKGPWYIIAVAALLTATLVRPNGILLIMVALIYLSSHIRGQALRWLVTCAIVLTFILGAIIILRFYPSGYSTYPVMALRYGITGIREWSVPMPFEPEPVGDEWRYLAGYVARHPFASLRLGVTRVAIELLHTRPFFSLRHNAALLATLPILYLLALLGLKLNRNSSLARLVVLTITAHLAVVAASYADWDGRFLLYVLPLICLLSSCALSSLIARYRRPLSTTRVREQAQGEDDAAVTVIE